MYAKESYTEKGTQSSAICANALLFTLYTFRARNSSALGSPGSWGSQSLEMGPFWDGSGCWGALVSSSWICGELGVFLKSRITRGLQGTQLDTVPRNTGKVSPLVH